MPTERATSDQPPDGASPQLGDPRFAPRPVEHEHDTPCPECGMALIKLRTDGRLFDPAIDDPAQPLNLICPSCWWAAPAEVPSGATGIQPRV